MRNYRFCMIGWGPAAAGLFYRVEWKTIHRCLLSVGASGTPVDRETAQTPPHSSAGIRPSRLSLSGSSSSWTYPSPVTSAHQGCLQSSAVSAIYTSTWQLNTSHRRLRRTLAYEPVSVQPTYNRRPAARVDQPAVAASSAHHHLQQAPPSGGEE